MKALRPIICTIGTWVILAVLGASVVSGHNGDVSRVPNGGVFSCDTCHQNGYNLNTFGVHYGNVGRQWTNALSQQDSDNDGWSNGAELLDPDGVWSQGQPDPGSPSDVTNPGDASSHPSDPTATPTSGPGTPTETPTPTLTPTPTATPSGDCTQTGVQIDMPSEFFMPGDSCYVSVQLCNAGQNPLSDIPVIVVLDILGAYYFAPGFSATFDYYNQQLPVGDSILEILPAFTWPTGAGSFQGAVWIAGMTNSEFTELFGEMDILTFGWGQ